MSDFPDVDPVIAHVAHCSAYPCETCDGWRKALEAKAAPVGELREAFEAAYAAECSAYRGAKFAASEIAELRDGDGYGDRPYLSGHWKGFQAGAAYQRAQQPSAGVVMPDAEGSAAQKSFWAGFESASLRLFGTDIRKAWNSYKASDEFARLNGKEVGRG